MNNSDNSELLGYFLKRKDIKNLAVVDLLRELQNHLFEATVIKLAIKSFQTKKISSLDCKVGDWKCQTRTSIIKDLYQNKRFSDEELSKELIKINEIINKNQTLFNQIQEFSPIECQALRKKLKNTSLLNFLKEHELNYNPSKDTTLLALCFLTTLKNQKLSVFDQYQISTNKIKALINNAKALLCLISIEYEQKLAKTYATPEEQKALEQIEVKNIQHMTALFIGFKSIFKKMVLKKQSFITDTKVFCACGGVQTTELKFFTPTNSQFTQTNMPLSSDQVITVIEAYQFPGSIRQLQTILGISLDQVDIPKEFYKPCHCIHSTKQPKVESIELAIMAFFAQHPQFTNGAQIDFAGLGLLDSELKKEYDYLNSLKGFSRNDMSQFWINHMYPATIAQVLEQHEQSLSVAQNIQPKLNQKISVIS